MARIRGCEMLFNLQKNNLKSKEDCVIIVLHCLLINEGLDCAGLGDDWEQTNSETTELLPNGWNSNQNIYTLRYISKDLKYRVLLKVSSDEHLLMVDVAMNEEVIASMSIQVDNYIGDTNEYSTTYKDLDSLSKSFHKEVLDKIQLKVVKKTSSDSNKQANPKSNTVPTPPLRSPFDMQRGSYMDSRRVPRSPFPTVGGSDLNPFGTGGGMFFDPSSFGIPSRPTLPQFGVGGPGGLPRGAVPPGARFDPFMPPIHPGGFQPTPDHFKPPDYDDYFM